MHVDRTYFSCMKVPVTSYDDTTASTSGSQSNTATGVCPVESSGMIKTSKFENSNILLKLCTLNPGAARASLKLCRVAATNLRASSREYHPCRLSRSLLVQSLGHRSLEKLEFATMQIVLVNPPYIARSTKLLPLYRERNR